MVHKFFIDGFAKHEGTRNYGSSQHSERELQIQVGCELPSLNTARKYVRNRLAAREHELDLQRLQSRVAELRFDHGSDRHSVARFANKPPHGLQHDADIRS